MTYRFDLSTIRKTEGLLQQYVGSETLLYNERTHHVFCLSPVASQVWQLLDSSDGIPQIAEPATLALLSPVDEEMVLFALGEFRRDGLIRETAQTLPPAIPSRRDLLQKLGAGAVMMVPVVAMVMAPRAAQAYNGCFDCNAVPAQGNEADETTVDPDTKLRQQQEQRAAAVSEQQKRASQPQPLKYPSLFRP
jgi:hypothetical protein